MYHLLDLLRRSPVVASVDIITFVDEGDVHVLSAKAVLTDGSVCFVRELVTADDAKYSYHWQTQSGALISRWDNAPHHRRVATFPHHKHIGAKNKILPSEEITLEAILAVIERMLIL